MTIERTVTPSPSAAGKFIAARDRCLKELFYLAVILTKLLTFLPLVPGAGVRLGDIQLPFTSHCFED